MRLHNPLVSAIPAQTGIQESNRFVVSLSNHTPANQRQSSLPSAGES